MRGRPVIGPAVNGSQAKATTQIWTQSRPSALTSASQSAPAGSAAPGGAPESGG